MSMITFLCADQDDLKHSWSQNLLLLDQNCTARQSTGTHHPSFELSAFSLHLGQRIWAGLPETLRVSGKSFTVSGGLSYRMFHTHGWLVSPLRPYWRAFLNYLCEKGSYM